MLADLVTEWCGQNGAAMPVDIIQYMFALLQPFQTVKKFAAFAELDPGSMEARYFVLLEDWLNDGVPLTAKVARDCLQGWYGDNVTAKLAWTISGEIIDPRKLAMPSYVVVAGRDRIVPAESALPLTRLLPHATLHQPMTGHIGMMASRKASHQVWKPLLHWLGEHL
jgi:poly(3-hydroxyalkanoate) synthetase